MALSKIESVHTVGTTISVTISMWLVKGSAKHTHTHINNSLALHSSLDTVYKASDDAQAQHSKG